MKIDPLSPGRSGSLRRSDRGGSAPSNGGFARVLGQASSPTAPAAPPVTLGRIDSILALQETGDPLERRRRSVKRGADLIESLEQIRLGLLTGAIERGELERLSAVLAERREAVEEPALARLLADIELRAAVELAKYRG